MNFQPCLELIFGPMFSGKSSELIRRIKRIKSVSNENDTIMLINSIIDTRVADNAIKTHDGNVLHAIKCTNLSELYENNKTAYDNCKIIFIDEAQFFPDLYDFCTRAVSEHKKHVVCAGLDADSSQRPFGQIISLIPHADIIEKRYALCMICCDGITQAPFTIMKKKDTQNIQNIKDTQIKVGANETYISVCRKHL